MKRSFLLIGLSLGVSFFMQTKLQSQNCPNLDFSMGNFTNWTGYLGTCNSGGGTAINPAPINPSRHAIMDAQLLYQLGKLYDEKCPQIPKVPPGFAYAAKLGNASAGAEMEALEYELSVDSNNSLLLVHFAWISDDPSDHSIIELSRFTMAIKDSNGNYMPSIPCSYVELHSCTLTCNPNIMGKNWTTVGFSLEKFMGQKIKIYFETRDCVFGGHFGYAYIVAECISMKIDLMCCPHSDVARLQAPPGFIYYKWTSNMKPGILQEGPNARQIILQNPVLNEVITCTMTSELVPGCDVEVKVAIVKTIINPYFMFGIPNSWHPPFPVDNWYDTCARTATFVDLSTVHNSKKDEILWEIFAPNNKNPICQKLNDSLFTFTFPDPYSTPVTYRVRLTVTAESGCTDTTSQYITIFPSPKVKIEGEPEICEGEGQWLKAKAIQGKFVNHTWNWVDTGGTLQTATGVDSIEIFTRGIYILTSLDSTGCYARDTFNVTVLRLKMNTEIEGVSCYGDASGIFEHGVVSGGSIPYYPYYWLFPKESGGYDTMPASPHGYRFTNLKAGIYICKGVDSKNCAIYGEIEIKQTDSLKISGTPYSTTCEEDNGAIIFSATGGLPPYKFSIKKDDGTPVSLTSTYAANGLSAGKYIITVTDAMDNKVIIDTTPTGIVRTILKKYSCTTSDTIEVKSQIISPTAIYLNYNTSTININQYITLTPIFYPADACNKDVIWHSEDTNIATVDENGTVRSIAYGETNIVVTSVEGNYQASCKVTVSNVEIKQLSLTNNKLQVFPNPTGGKLRVTGYELQKNTNIEIYDIVGCNVGTYRIRLENNETIIDISHLTAGMYFMKIDGKTVKIVKQ
jgi:hypothetical protein